MIEEVLEGELELHFEKGVCLEALCNNLAVRGQRVYNFLDYTGIGHDFSDAFLFAVLGRRLGRQDELLAHFGKLLFESICDGL